ncbi:MAG TPA: phosphoesterase [Polyangia bacterium]|jgi:hypothetical protein|nr:phosphoesterase [Polyangia bacterium]
MRVRVCFHDNCFDGAASAAIFTAFYRSRIDPSAEILYRGMTHGHGEVFPAGTFDGDENVVVDFRYSSDPKLTWWFDHHVSAFPRPEDEAHFRQQPSERKFYDPAARSCTRFLARSVSERFRFDADRYGELIHWAEIIDGAMFESAESAVRLAEPALRLMTWIENNKEPALTERFIAELVAARPLGDLVTEPWIQEPLGPIFVRNTHALDVVRSRSRDQGGVVSFDIAEDQVETYNKFIPYYLYPQARFVVGLSAAPGRLKISVGSNPWLPRPPVNIAAICERYGGGGHPVVGAISLPAHDLSRARTIAEEIAEELRAVPATKP